MSESEYKKLISEYRMTISTTEGCGERGQFYIDNIHDKLRVFCKYNPS